MIKRGNLKIFGAGVFFLLLIGTMGSYAVPPNPPQFGILNYDPQSHDFGNMSEGEINSTIFGIWTSGGCCELTFNLTPTVSWITVFPTSGVSNGEVVNITVTVDTTGLDAGPYVGDVLITTNGGGNGDFVCNVNVIVYNYPYLAFYPQTHFFGVIPANTIDSTTFEVWNSGAGCLRYTLTPDSPWVTVSTADGTSHGEHNTITVGIDTTGMTPGTTYQSYVHVDSNGGNKVYLVWFIIGTLPKVEVKSISGGWFKIQSVITNTGTANAMGVDWKITVDGNGLVLLGKESKGTLPGLGIGESRTVSSGLIFGFGDVIITVSAQNAEALPATLNTPAKLFLFYVKI